VATGVAAAALSKGSKGCSDLLAGIVAYDTLAQHQRWPWNGLDMIENGVNVGQLGPDPWWAVWSGRNMLGTTVMVPERSMNLPMLREIWVRCGENGRCGGRRGSRSRCPHHHRKFIKLAKRQTKRVGGRRVVSYAGTPVLLSRDRLRS